MELQRLQEVVEAYHYDIRQPIPEHENLQTSINVEMTPISNYEEKPEGSSAIQARVRFQMAFSEFLISGFVSQINFILNREVKEQSDVSNEEVHEIVQPLFDLIKRLTYEVTEIALDRPGLELNFGAQMTPPPVDEKEEV
ncbi:MAG: DUF1149 family protein [Streptococcaceae bacterium]|jgi:hypothetical protein|nr:DUF1149 family protein [Streptococcaceae bacterium]